MQVIAPVGVRPGPAATELTMEYAPNGTLDAYVRRLGQGGARLPEGEARRLFGQMARGLRADCRAIAC